MLLIVYDSNLFLGSFVISLKAREVKVWSCALTQVSSSFTGEKDLLFVLSTNIIVVFYFIHTAYCPYGPSNPVISGLQSNFDVEGEQWAPVYGQENHWVLITRKGNNLSTSCLTYTQLYDEMPSWGLDDSNKELKQHIMCCSPIQ
jgi:hypothetical protein